MWGGAEEGRRMEKESGTRPLTVPTHVQVPAGCILPRSFYLPSIFPFIPLSSIHSLLVPPLFSIYFICFFIHFRSSIPSFFSIPFFTLPSLMHHLRCYQTYGRCTSGTTGSLPSSKSHPPGGCDNGGDEDDGDDDGGEIMMVR